jgi:type I restriction enzyme S subunit
MKQGWEIKKISDVCLSLEDGDWIEKKNQSTKGIRLIQTGNIGCGVYKDKSEKAKYISEDTFRTLKCTEVVAGDILVSRLPDPVGRACIVPYLSTKCITAVDCSIVKLNPKIISAKWFIYYTLSAEYKTKVIAECSGTTRDRISRKKLSVIPLPIPPLAEQRRIVEILDREFERIDALKANAEQNLQHAKDLFQAALKQELQPKEGWERCKLCEVCTFYNGKPHENDIDENGEYILVNSKFISSDMQVYKKTSSQFFPLFAGDIVMVMSDVPNGKALAKCQIIHKDNLYSLNQRICVFRDAKIDVKLLYYLVNRNPYLIAFDNGENQTNLRKNDIVSMPICHPTNTKEVAGIVARLDYFRNKCQTLEENYKKTIALCDDMKQALLRKAFNGEL